mmetsp:Transcript_73039/g.156446  ORF Transcript_73039/g.156446 Transcript_73039/m.156446 type:complete len:278 (-) Transcript_73039:275-1108(-)
MAVLAKVFVAMAALFAVAFANNSTNANATVTVTETTTLTTTVTVFSTTATTTPSGPSGPTVTVTTATLTTTDPNATETTTTLPAEHFKALIGSIGITITGDCQAFVTSDAVNSAWVSTIASVSSVQESMVTVFLSHTCSSRRLHVRSLSKARRLDGDVLVSYTITIPAGQSYDVNTISNAITTTSATAWTNQATAKLQSAGITVFGVTVNTVSTPSVAVVTTTETTTPSVTGTTVTATTTMTLPAAGIDSSAFFRKAFSSAHLWALIVLFAANHFFA